MWSLGSSVWANRTVSTNRRQPGRRKQRTGSPEKGSLNLWTTECFKSTDKNKIKSQNIYISPIVYEFEENIEAWVYKHRLRATFYFPKNSRDLYFYVNMYIFMPNFGKQ